MPFLFERRLCPTSGMFDDFAMFCSDFSVWKNSRRAFRIGDISRPKATFFFRHWLRCTLATHVFWAPQALFSQRNQITEKMAQICAILGKGMHMHALLIVVRSHLGIQERYPCNTFFAAPLPNWNAFPKYCHPMLRKEKTGNL